MRKINSLESNFKIWESLIDTSIYFTLAGLKVKGYSHKKAWQRVRSLWRNSSEDHICADLEIIKNLYARRDKNK